MRALFFLLVLAASALAGAETGLLGEGTRHETRWYLVDSSRPGPLVAIVGGCHGDEPAGALAADQIRRWPLRRGRLLVVPRANPPALRAGTRYTPGTLKTLRNLNRNYGVPLAGEQAPRIWALLETHRPDWILDLHEGYDVHRLNPKSVGSSVIAAPDAAAAAARMVAAVNDGGVLDASRRFVLLPKPVAGSLAAAAKRLGARGMTLETTTKGQARSYRTRQHRILVRRLLLDLRMIDPEVVTPNTMTSADADTVKVAVYDSIGTGGKGVPSILRQLGPHRRFEAERMCITDMRAGALAAFDCVVFSGGTGSGQGLALGDDGRAAVARFVKGGGGYVGVCAGAYLATAKYSWGLGVLDARTVSPKWRRGRATVQAELTPEGVAIFGERGRFPVLYANGPILAPAGLEQLPDYTPLAVFRTEVARNGTPKGIMVDSPAIVAGRCGEGRVLCMSPHPEQTRGLEDFIPRAVLWTTGAGE